MPLPPFRPETGTMRLRGCDFYLIELKLDGSLASEHGDDHADAVLFDLNCFHDTGEGTEGTIEDADTVANIVIDNDLFFLDTHCVDFIISQGNGVITGRANKACNMS